MPDTVSHLPLVEAKFRSARKRSVWDDWANYARPALYRSMAAGLAMVTALDEMRGTMIWAEEIREHDLFAVDQVGGLVDYLSDAVGRARKAYDEAHGDPDEIGLEVTDLLTAHALLKARVEARTPPTPTGAPCMKAAA